MSSSKPIIVLGAVHNGLGGAYLAKKWLPKPAEPKTVTTSPGLPGVKQRDPQYLGFDSEFFTIMEGPANIDGLLWWVIVSFSDETRAGWAASNFLEVVQEPD